MQRRRAVRNTLRVVAALGTCGIHLAQAAAVHEITAQIDVRAVAVDSPLRSFTQGGMGLLRFDEDHEGVRLGRVLLDANGPVTQTLRYTITASATADGDQNPIDLTEAVLEWRPYPTNTLRWRARVGAFYAPISLENRTIGWQSLYSISPSAINTWIGEEQRTLGAELSVTAAGAPSNRPFDLTLLAAAFAWNDPMGVLIFERGWAIHDRQSPLMGNLPRPLAYDPNNRKMEFFHEIDNRAGYYVGAEMRTRSDSVVRLLHYDNRGDTKAASVLEPAWLTRFDALGMRLELPAAVTLIVQGMNGDTAFGNFNGQPLVQLDYWSYFGLLSRAFGPHRYTVRYDRMYTETVRGAQFINSEQNSHAWTLAYSLDIDAHWQIAAEALRINGSLAQRALQGLPETATEQQLQMAVRFTF